MPLLMRSPPKEVGRVRTTFTPLALFMLASINCTLWWCTGSANVWFPPWPSLGKRGPPLFFWAPGFYPRMLVLSGIPPWTWSPPSLPLLIRPYPGNFARESSLLTWCLRLLILRIHIAGLSLPACPLRHPLGPLMGHTSSRAPVGSSFFVHSTHREALWWNHGAPLPERATHCGLLCVRLKRRAASCCLPRPG